MQHFQGEFLLLRLPQGPLGSPEVSTLMCEATAASSRAA